MHDVYDEHVAPLDDITALVHALNLSSTNDHADAQLHSDITPAPAGSTC